MIYRLLLLLSVVGHGFAQTATRPLTILHSNDLHARFLPDTRNLGGFAQFATVIRRETAGCKWCIVLNAGDLVQGSPVSTIFRGVPVYQVANKLGIQVSTLGNHEFDYGWQKILKFIQIARFPIVSANVVDGDGKLLARNPYVIRKVNGIRVAIIGAVMGNLVSTYLAAGVAGPYHALPVVETVRRNVEEIGDRADLIVVLGHIEPAERTEILHGIPKVALVVTGHSHRGLEKEEVVEGRVGVETKAYGVELGRLDMQVDVGHGSLASWTWKKIPVDAGTVKPAPDVKKMIDKWEAKVSKIVDVPIGESKREFAASDLRGLIERAMAEEMHADFGVMNQGGVRDRLPKGKILARAVWNIMPFDNKMVVGKLKGSQLSEAITRGRPVDPGREYIVSMSDFSAGNEHEQKVLGITGLQFETKDVLLRDLLINWIKKQGTLD
ncbi:MAG: bifunctional UDP-sugar hydrolase/5'-nucleotidase [Bryobacteraceae bacterium]